MPPNPPLLLASTSPHRRALLARLQLPFEALPPGVAEDELPGEAPRERALRLAVAKARALAGSHAGALVIGSDQVASLAGPAGDSVLHKPGTRAATLAQLAAMSGRTASFHTAVAVVRGARTLTHCDLTQVRFHMLTAAQIESYVEREPAFDCAGGFKCEGLGVTLFESVSTRDPTALVGLPLIFVCAALRELGVAV